MTTPPPVAEVLTEILAAHPGPVTETDARIAFVCQTYGYEPADVAGATAAMALGFGMLVGAASDLADLGELDSMQVAAVEKLAQEFMCACARVATLEVAA